MDSEINKVHSPTIFCVVLSDLMGFWDASISSLDHTRRHIGSLSARVFETRTATGSKLFSLLTCLHTTTFILLSIVSPLEMISLKVWEIPLS